MRQLKALVHQIYSKELALAIMLIIISVLMRLIPHPPNFTPVIAIALFSGNIITKSNKYLAYITPIAIMLIADSIIGFHSTLFYVYTSLLIITFIGGQTSVFSKLKTTLFSSTLSAVVFFFITNTAVWFHSDMYSKSLLGLWSCFVMAIPFFHNTL